MDTRYGSWDYGKALPQEPKILLIDGVTKKVAAGMGCHLLYMYSGDVCLQIGQPTALSKNSASDGWGRKK